MSGLMQRAREENLLCTALLELTYACNLACQFCYNDLAFKGKRLTLEDYRGLLDDMAGMGTLGLTLSGGEPLLHPQFFEIGAYARKLGFSIGVKSNGVPLNERNARRLKQEVDPWQVDMSLHGARPETHDRQTMQAGSLERMLENIKHLRDLGIRMRLNSVLTKYNEDELEGMFEIADELGVPLSVNAEITPKDNGDMSPLQLTASEAARKKLFRITTERVLHASANSRAKAAHSMPVASPAAPRMKDASSKAIKNCGVGSTSVAIDPFGNVYPCVQMRHKVGNIHEQSIREIWGGSDELKRIRSLAYLARESSLKNGLKTYCMGAAELITGDPLKVHEEALLNDRLQRQARKEWTGS